MTAIGAITGLQMEAVQPQVQNGLTLAEIIAASGGDLEGVKATLQEALADVCSATGGHGPITCPTSPTLTNAKKNRPGRRACSSRSCGLPRRVDYLPRV